MALGETQIVQETRQFLLDNNVSLDSFSQVCVTLTPIYFFLNCPLKMYFVRIPITVAKVVFCTCHFSWGTGGSSEEYSCDPCEKPSSWSDSVRVGGALLNSWLFGSSAAATLRTHCYHRVPWANWGKTSLHSASVQQGVCNFLPVKPAHVTYF